MASNRRMMQASHSPQGGLELNWEGKYDETGRRRAVVAESAKLELLEQWGKGAQNRLILGDNRLVISALMEELRGKVTLIYADPPYDVGADFTMKVPVGNTGVMLDQIAYRDVWGRGRDSYLHRMYERLVLMRELLSEEGTLYLHVDYRVQAALRLILDEVFGADRFMNEIIWAYKTGGVPDAFGFARKHDTILVYRKGARPVFHEIRQKSYAPTLPEPHTPSGTRLGVRREPTCDLCGKGSPGQKYREVLCRDVWDDLPSIFRNDGQSTGFATQKPEALLERIITASSRPGDLVADFFCGSGTTGVVAGRMGRQWIMSDLGERGIQVARKRLLHTGSGAFDLYGLGRAERQLWLRERFAGDESAYLAAIKAAYGEETSVISDRLTAESVQKGVCLAWEFAPGLQQPEGTRFVRIPRELMEPKARSSPIFPELAHLEWEWHMGAVRLLRYRPSFAGVSPSKQAEIEAASSPDGLDYVDFWAIDPEWNPGEPFRAEWHAFRTKGCRTLATATPSRSQSGRGALKIVDLFGEERLFPL